jgi:hypothetical protein
MLPLRTLSLRNENKQSNKNLKVLGDAPTTDTVTVQYISYIAQIKMMWWRQGVTVCRFLGGGAQHAPRLLLAEDNLTP